LAVIKIFYPYNAFIDESIQTRHGSTMVAVTAYVATFERWLKLEEEWRAILRRFRVPLDGKRDHREPFFHMTDFIARKKQFQNDWSDEKRDRFIELLTTTASEHTILGAGCGVLVDEYERAMPDDIRSRWRDPYFFCVWAVLSILMGVERHYRVTLPKPIWCLFDRKQKAQKFAGEIFYTLKRLKDKNAVLREMAFGSMPETPQLQAADLLVYEVCRHRLEAEYNPSAGIRKSMDKLRRKSNLYVMYLDKKRLQRYVEDVRKAEAVGDTEPVEDTD
jgi:hypothetical protein